jgi:transitional endoplasmic reticulum ATPase
MDEFGYDTLRKRWEAELKKHKTKAEQLHDSDPDAAADHLTAAADFCAKLADLEHEYGYESVAETLADKAEEYRSKGERLSSAEQATQRADSGGDAPAQSDPAVDDESVDIDLDDPGIDFGDVGGMDGLKQRLRNNIAKPVRLSALYELYDLDPVSGVLFQGPPGTGKTYITRALAGEIGWNFIEIEPDKVVSSLVGEAAQNISDIFAFARENEPCLLFFDELDSIALDRTSATQGTQSERLMMTQLLQEFNDLSNHDVVVVGATNAPEEVDDALLNSRRFEYVIEIPKPDPPAREAILHVHMRDRPVNERSIDYDEIRELTEGFTAADLESVADNAARKAADELADDVESVQAIDRNSLQPITDRHLKAAIEDRKQSIAESERGGYL